jgi:hypothetical protein
MGWSHIAIVTGTAATGTTVNASSSLNVAANDLLVASFHWQSGQAADTITIDQSDGTDTFTNIANTKTVEGNDFGTGMAYLVVAGADAAFTPRFTLSAAGIELDIFVRQFRPDSGATVSLDTSNGSSGFGTALVSGTVTTTGTDEVAVGCGGQGNGTSLTSEQINSVDADAATDSASLYYNNWYRILTATFAGGQATETAGGAASNWGCAIACFKSVGAGGSTTLWAQSVM